VSQENVKIVRQLSEAFNSDARGWGNCYSPDADLKMAWRRPHQPTTYTGPEGMRAAAADLRGMFQELRWERELLIDAGDRVVGLFRRLGRHQDGTPVEMHVAGVFELHGGKVVRVQGYESWSAAIQSVSPEE
jgi:ketosteroid isomerase-like protein